MRSNTSIPASVDLVVREALVAVLVSVTVAPETTRPCGSVMVPRIVDVPVGLHVREVSAESRTPNAQTRGKRMELSFENSHWRLGRHVQNCVCHRDRDRAVLNKTPRLPTDGA